MLGRTWEATLNGALDKISELQRDRDDALDAVADFMMAHPEHDTDPNLTIARIALQ